VWSNLRLVTISNTAVISLRTEAWRLRGIVSQRNFSLGRVADISPMCRQRSNGLLRRNPDTFMRCGEGPLTTPCRPSAQVPSARF
jgi:hypothetical protein